MDKIEAFMKSTADFLWGDWLLAALLGLGVFYTIMTGGIQFRCFVLFCKGFFKEKNSGKGAAASDGSCSSYQALCAAVASCVGSGNIVGVSTAILSGGAGALFWMWVAAFFGMATKFGEIVLGIHYHGYDDKHNITGGPMYYISKGLNWKWAGALVAALLFIQNSGATLIQSNTITQVAKEAFHASGLVTGILLAVIMSLVISGGFKRLIQVAQRIVPIMAGCYLVCGLIVLLANAGKVPAMLSQILEGAFTLQAGTGALTGIMVREAMRYGVARGLYSNEAGEGSAAVLHASAKVDHPVRQGLYGVIEVFIDTILICSTTGFMVLITGVTESHTNATTLAAKAFGTVLPGLENLIYISLLLFAGTSIMSQWYFGHVSLQYLKKPGIAAVYRLIFPVLILFGSQSSVGLVWSIQDIALGLLIIPNILALVFLAPQVRKLTREFLNPGNGYMVEKENKT